MGYEYIYIYSKALTHSNVFFYLCEILSHFSINLSTMTKHRYKASWSNNNKFANVAQGQFYIHFISLMTAHFKHFRSIFMAIY